MQVCFYYFILFFMVQVLCFSKLLTVVSLQVRSYFYNFLGDCMYKFRQNTNKLPCAMDTAKAISY